MREYITTGGGTGSLHWGLSGRDSVGGEEMEEKTVQATGRHKAATAWVRRRSEVGPGVCAWQQLGNCYMTLSKSPPLLESPCLAE